MRRVFDFHLLKAKRPINPGDRGGVQSPILVFSGATLRYFPQERGGACGLFRRFHPAWRGVGADPHEYIRRFASASGRHMDLDGLHHGNRICPLALFGVCDRADLYWRGFGAVDRAHDFCSWEGPALARLQNREACASAQSAEFA